MSHPSDNAPTSTTNSDTIDQLSREFGTLYHNRISKVKACRGKREGVHRSREELTQAAFAWLWERLCKAVREGEDIHSLSSMFRKSAVPTERQKTARYLQKLWLLEQKAQLQSGSGSFRAPQNGWESEIGVGQRADHWQESPVEEHACAVELLARFDEVRQTLTEREQLVLTALVSGLPGREAADALGMSENNYRQVVFRLRRKLRASLDE